MFNALSSEFMCIKALWKKNCVADFSKSKVQILDYRRAAEIVFSMCKSKWKWLTFSQKGRMTLHTHKPYITKDGDWKMRYNFEREWMNDNYGSCVCTAKLSYIKNWKKESNKYIVKRSSLTNKLKQTKNA